MADKKKSSWQTVEEYQTEKLNKRTADAIKESKKITKEKKDSYTERNEFKPGFYDQPSKPPITPETYYGTASGKTSFVHHQFVEYLVEEVETYLILIL